MTTPPQQIGQRILIGEPGNIKMLTLPKGWSLCGEAIRAITHPSHHCGAFQCPGWPIDA